MGLTTTHRCYNGSYGYFGMWRNEIARVIGIELDKMEGYTGFGNPGVAWDSIKKDAAHILLNHPDNEGHINWKDTKKLADRLEELLPEIKNYPPDNDFKAVTKKFIAGLRLAHRQHERVLFG